MKEVPAKIKDKGTWHVSKIGLGDTSILLSAPLNREISFKSIEDIEERKNILAISLKQNPPVTYWVASVPKVMLIIKRLILMNCNAYRLNAYFMSPAIRGGVLINDAKWEKGTIAVLKSGIWFVNQQKQICVPIQDVSNIEQTKREVNGKPTEVVKIDHVQSGDVLTNFVLCPVTTLQVLFNFLKDATKDSEMQGNELDGMSAQVAMLVYSGMDSKAIVNILQISNKQLEAVYDSLLDLGIVEVTRIHREVNLTTKGVRFVTDASKSPNN